MSAVMMVEVAALSGLAIVVLLATVIAWLILRPGPPYLGGRWRQDPTQRTTRHDERVR